MTASEMLDDFVAFAKQQLEEDANASIDELYADWRAKSVSELDAQAILASVQDLENGERGVPLEDFLARFDTERGLSQ